MVNSLNVETFKARLDQHWENQEILFNHGTELEITTVVTGETWSGKKVDGEDTINECGWWGRKDEDNK